MGRHTAAETGANDDEVELLLDVSCSCGIGFSLPAP